MRLFLFKLDQREAARSGGEIEVQLLDGKGRAKDTAYVSRNAELIRIGGKDYPHTLLARATSLKEGQGVYVDEQGNEIQPF